VPCFVPIHDDLRRVLEALSSRLRAARPGARHWVFPNSAGTGPLGTHDWIAPVFLPAVRNARPPGLSAHPVRSPDQLPHLGVSGRGGRVWGATHSHRDGRASSAAIVTSANPITAAPRYLQGIRLRPPAIRESPRATPRGP